MRILLINSGLMIVKNSIIILNEKVMFFKTYRQFENQFMHDVQISRLLIIFHKINYTTVVLESVDSYKNLISYFQINLFLLKLSLFIRVLGKEYRYVATDSGSERMLDDQTPVVKTLILKQGAQVMLLKNVNVSSGLVNGARGIVTSFSSSGLYYIKLFKYVFILCLIVFISSM